MKVKFANCLYLDKIKSNKHFVGERIKMTPEKRLKIKSEKRCENKKAKKKNNKKNIRNTIIQKHLYISYRP